MVIWHLGPLALWTFGISDIWHLRRLAPQTFGTSDVWHLGRLAPPWFSWPLWSHWTALLWMPFREFILLFRRTALWVYGPYQLKLECFFSNLSRFSLISQFLDYSHHPSFVCLPNPPNTFRVWNVIVIDPLLKNFPIYPSVNSSVELNNQKSSQN